MSKVQPTKTHVLSDYELGKWMYRRCVAFEACTNDRMRDGWNVAENNTAWGIYDDSPEDAVRFEYSQPWNAASAGVYPGKAITPKTNSGYDYESRREPNERVASIQ